MEIIDIDLPPIPAAPRIVLPRGGMRMRPYQGQAFEAAEDGWTKYLKQYLAMATGTGKTPTLAAIAQAEVKRGKPVLVLAHRDELLKQAASKIRRFTGIETELEKADNWASHDAAVVVASVQTLRQSRLDCWARDHFGMVITDECHRSLASSYQNIYSHFTGAKLLGVTATPDRGDKRHIGTFYDNCAFSYSIIDAVIDGWLVRPIAQTIPLEIDLKGLRTKRGIDGNDYSAEELEQRIAPLMDTICAEIASYSRGLQTVIFTPGVSTARMCSEALQRLGISADFISGACDDRDQKRARFERGEVTHMANCSLWTEGYDFDAISCVVPLRPTQSRGLYCQMVGRSTRPLTGLVDPIPTAEQRRIAIAKSAKPRALILDFFWQTERHDLIRPVHALAKDQRQAEEMQKKVKIGEEVDLIQSQRDAEMALLERLAEEAKKHSKKRRRTIDPLAFAVAVKDPDLAEYEPESSREMIPPTPDQIKYLDEQGVDTKGIKYFGHASKLIDRLHSRAAAGLCSLSQMTLLLQWGYNEDEVQLMKKGQAGFLIGNRRIKRKHVVAA